jgi:hypothetical protein
LTRKQFITVPFNSGNQYTKENWRDNYVRGSKLASWTVCSDKAWRIAQSAQQRSVEKLLTYFNSVLWTRDSVPNGTGILENLKIVSAWSGFITEEMNLVEFGDVLKAESLVPSRREDIEADLAPDGEREAKVSELELHGLHHRLADAGPLAQASSAGAHEREDTHRGVKQAVTSSYFCPIE